MLAGNCLAGAHSKLPLSCPLVIIEIDTLTSLPAEKSNRTGRKRKAEEIRATLATSERYYCRR